MSITNKVYKNINKIEVLDDKLLNLDNLSKKFVIERKEKEKKIIEKITKHKVFNQIKCIHDKNTLLLSDLKTSKPLCTFSFSTSNKPIDFSIDNSSYKKIIDFKLDLISINNATFQDLNTIIKIGKISEVFQKRKSKIINDLNKCFQIFLNKLFTKIRPNRLKIIEKHQIIYFKTLQMLKDQMVKISSTKGLKSKNLFTWHSPLEGNLSYTFDKLFLVKSSKNKYILKMSVEKNTYELQTDNKETISDIISQFVVEASVTGSFKDIINYLNEQNGEIL